MPRSDQDVPKDRADLRLRAEELLRRHINDLRAPSPQEVQELVHELEVHRIELEMQNQELREAQQGLEQARDRYADLYDFAPQGYVTLDARGIVREINLTAARMLGKERARLVGYPFITHVEAADRPVARGHLRQCSQGHEKVTSEVRLAIKGAEPIIVQLFSVAAQGPADGQTLYRSAITDITELKQTQQELQQSKDGLKIRVREKTADLAKTVDSLQEQVNERIAAEEATRQSEQRYRLLFELSPDGILLAVGGKIRMINQAGAALLGAKSSEKLVGKDVMGFVHPDSLEVARRRLRRLVEERQPTAPGELKLIRIDGSIVYCEASSAPVTHEGQPAFLTVFHDVTERRRLQKEVLRVSEAEKQRIGQDLHDGLGQILTGVACLSQALDNKLAEASPDVAAEAGRIATLVSESVTLARSLARGLSPIRQEPDSLMIALKELAANVTGMFGVACVCEWSRPVMIEGHLVAAHVYRIAQEAASNAARHGHARSIVISLTQSGPEAILTVADDGVGLPDDVEQAEGMGLRIMQYRADTIGASLDIRRRAEGGTAVTCRLRQTAEKTSPPAGGAAEPTARDQDASTPKGRFTSDQSRSANEADGSTCPTPTAASQAPPAAD